MIKMKFLILSTVVPCVFAMTLAHGQDKDPKLQSLNRLHEKYVDDQKKIIFQNLPYAAEVSLKGIVTSEQGVLNIFAGKEPVLFDSRLKGDDAYLVIELTNKGRMAAWGRLKCSVSDAGSVEVSITFLTPQPLKKRRFVVPLDGLPLDDLTSGVSPKVTFQWMELYAKG